MLPVSKPKVPLGIYYGGLSLGKVEHHSIIGQVIASERT